MFKIKNKKIVIIIIVCIALITYLSLRGCSNGGGQVYRYEEAITGEVKKTVSTSGTLELIDPVTISSKVSGFVTNVYVNFNSKVEKGQLLALLDSTDIDQQILKIEGQKESAALELAAAQSELNDKKSYVKDNLISQKQLEQAQMDYKKADIKFKQIQYDYNIAKKNKENTRIAATVSGVIMDMNIKPNDSIPANKQVFVIAKDLTKMQLIILIDESDIGIIKTDQRVTFSVSAYPDKLFEGEITQVRQNPIKKGEFTSYQALVACDNKELLLKQGMNPTATVEVDTRKNVLRVRNDAFYTSPIDIENAPGKKYVWKKQSASLDTLPVKRIEVKTGLVGNDYTEIISDNIKAGDEILVGMNRKSSETDLLRK